jgi:hypothetical protein
MKKSRYSLLPLVAALLLGCGTSGTTSDDGVPDDRVAANEGEVGNDVTTDHESNAGFDRRTPPQPEPTAAEKAVAALVSFGAFVRQDDGQITLVMPEKTTDGDLMLLTELENLRALSLGGTQITDAGLETVGRFTQLEALYLYRANVGDAGLAHLGDLSNLRELSLAWTNVTDEGLRSLQLMRQLAELDVAWTAVSDEGLAHLEGLKNLQAMVTQGSDVSDDGFALLQQAIPDARQAEEDTVARAPETPAPLDLDAIEATEEAESSVIGQAAPEIEGEDIDGVAFKLSDYRGKVVLIDFWGHW